MQQSERKPARGLRSALEVASLEVCVMGSLSEGLALNVFPYEVGRRRKPVEIVGLESGFAVGRFEQTVRVGPRPLVEQRPSALECFHFRHVASLSIVDPLDSLLTSTAAPIRKRDYYLISQLFTIYAGVMSALEEFLAIRRAVSLWETRAAAALGGLHGLSLSDFAALHHLSEAPGYRLRRIDLAQRLALTPSGITRLLNPLERRRIVSREEDGHDARATYAVLTNSGRALIKDAQTTMSAFAEGLLRSLSERDRTALARLGQLPG
jgi:DNA-binding MarR family transcriptional regulator